VLSSTEPVLVSGGGDFAEVSLSFSLFPRRDVNVIGGGCDWEEEGRGVVVVLVGDAAVDGIAVVTAEEDETVQLSWPIGVIDVSSLTPPWAHPRALSTTTSADIFGGSAAIIVRSRIVSALGQFFLLMFALF
jgi:hypothetical protein